MNCKTYKNIEMVMNYYIWRGFNGKITDEDLSDIYGSKFEKYITREDIEIIEKIMNSKNLYRSLYDLMKADFEKMTPEEIKENIKEFSEEDIMNENILEILPDKVYVLDALENFSIQNQRNILYNMDLETILEYINKNGKSTEILCFYIANDYKLTRFAIENSQSDLIKTKILLKQTEKVFFPCINDPFYRTQLIKKFERDISEQELLNEIMEYNKYLEELSQMSDEKEKAKYISEIENRDIKQILLLEIKSPENRKKIIQSFNRTVDPEIASLDNVAQTMIREFFEDSLGEKFTEDKKERLDIIFSRTDVSFDYLTKNTNGMADYVDRKCIISNRHKNNINRNIGFLIHEYSHLFSHIDFGYTYNSSNHTIEEGMADLFADLVINSYLKKHENLVIDGEKVRIDNPYEVYSGYDFENAYARTILAGLEKKGKDYEVIAEYLLGNKMKFAEMVFGKEEAQNMETTSYGMPKIIPRRKNIYNSTELDYSDINEESIYYKRNHILPLFCIQNEVKDKEDIVSIVERRESWKSKYIAKLYFDEKKFYEIPVEELEKFIQYLDLQKAPPTYASVITGIFDYKNNEIDELTEDIINEYSFEILERIPILYGKEQLNAGVKLEKCIDYAIGLEIEKIKSGQPFEITMEKKDKIVSEYKRMFSEKNESNMYIIDAINNYLFTYEEAKKEHEEKKQNILNGDVIKKIAKDEKVALKKDDAQQCVYELEKTEKTNENNINK